MSQSNGKHLHPCWQSDFGFQRSHDSSLWAVTCYFNPIGYRRRLTNYRLFRRHLAVPLVTVELSYRGEFELNLGDADRLIQLRGRDVLWQKERLLNVALRHLPDSCQKVAWLDCDVLFGDADWARRAASVLDEVPMIQPFNRLFHLPREWDYGDPRAAAHAFDERSFAGAMACGLSPVTTSTPNGVRGAGNVAKGVAWAARRDLLEKHGFYDAGIIGGGDSAMACAAFGRFDHPMRSQVMNERQRERYLAWAVPFSKSVGGAVSFINVDLFHLWHGDMADRHYADRFQRLSTFEFNPSRDVAVDDSGCWRWNSDNVPLHDYVRDFFASRNEDG